MAAKQPIKIKTDLEKQLYDCYIQEKTDRENLQQMVRQLNGHIQSLQEQVQDLQGQLNCLKAQEKKGPTDKQVSETRTPAQPTKSDVEYCTDEDELAKETGWIRAKNRKKRKLNTSLTPPPLQQASTSAQQQQLNSKEKATFKKNLAPPPIVVDGVKNYQTFYDYLIETQPIETFTAKMLSGNSVKINAKTEESYRVIARRLTENNCLWHSYEDKQTRPIRVVAKKLHSSCLPDRIKDDLTSQGFQIENATNKLSWRTKEPLNMFILSFKNDEDVSKIYGIKHILGCKVEITPLKTSKIIPQCKRCQAYGHTQKYCSKEPRCVKCTGKHLTAECNKPAEEKPKCVHCGLPHPANYRGCLVAKEMQAMKNKIAKNNSYNDPAVKQTVRNTDKQTPKQSAQFAQTTAKTAHASKSVSYAQAVKPSTQPSSLEDKLNQILKCLSSFDKRLEKLESNTIRTNHE